MQNFVPVLFSDFENGTQGSSLTPELVLFAEGLDSADEQYLANRARVWLGVSLEEGCISLFIDNKESSTQNILRVYLEYLKLARDT